MTSGNKSAGAPFSGKPLSAHEAGKFAARTQETPDSAQSYGAPAVGPEAAQLAKLTGREAQILGLMAERMTNTEISARLGRELATIEKHVENLYRNLEVKTRADAIAIFLRRENAEARREIERLRQENSELRERVAELMRELAEAMAR